jgi:hypothetical protein
MAPRPEVVRALPEGLEAWTLAEPGRQYAVYVFERGGSRPFGARWTATLTPPTTGEYTFTTVSDDGVRLWVDGRLVLENWTDHGATEDSGRVRLTAGRPVDLRLDFYQGAGGAVARLLWTRPDGVTGVVPPAHLSAPGDGGKGWRAEYFEDPALAGGPALVRAERTIDAEWKAGESPLPPPPPRSGSATLTLALPPGRYAAEWVDPLSGGVAKREDILHAGGLRTLVAPPFGSDVALAVRPAE